MLKLLTVNMEGTRHITRILSLINTTQPNCICFQEMPTMFVHELTKIGYYSTIAPMILGTAAAPEDTIGVGFASRTPADVTSHYYDGSVFGITPYTRESADDCSAFVTLHAHYKHNNTTYDIVTTHVIVTPDGETTPAQTNSITKLLAYTTTLPPHILCGDMNMPRGYNQNYPRFLQRYTDAVPSHYKSSLDKTLHRAGNRTDLNAPIFDTYMVDYIFSQSPYTVHDVTFHFGVSDHAAVSCSIEKQA
jgi:endonuclease/exonuclease/phosphatase family metal-dependent hydrolase